MNVRPQAAFVSFGTKEQWNSAMAAQDDRALPSALDGETGRGGRLPILDRERLEPPQPLRAEHPGPAALERPVDDLQDPLLIFGKAAV